MNEYGQSEDITGCKQQDARLVESEARYKTLAEASFEGIVVSIGGVIVDVNDQFLEMSGYAREELIGTPVLDMIAPESRDVVAEAIRTRRLDPYKNVLLRKDHQRLVAETRARSVQIGGSLVRISALRDITERERVEEALRFTQYVMDNMFDIAYWVAPDGRLIYANNAATELMGYTREELLNMNISDISPTRTPENWSAHWQKLHDEKKLMFETKHRTKSGREILVEVTANMVEFGGKEYNCAFIRDITERKQAEETLKSSQAFLDGIIEHCPISTWIADDKGVYVRQNQACRDTFHTRDADIIGKYNILEDYYLREHGFIPLIKRVFENGEAVRFCQWYDSSQVETVAIKEPVRLFLDVTIWPAFDADGRITNAIGQQVDLTERERAEEELRESSQMLKLVLDTIPVSVWWKDRNCVYLGSNYRAVYAGLASPEEIVGKTDFDLPWGADEAAAYQAGDREVMETGVPKIDFEETLHAFDGRILSIRTSKVPLRDANGDVIGVLGTFEDITERKNAEMALRLSQHLIENMSDMAFWITSDARFIYVNQAAIDLLGYTRDELLNMTVPDVNPSFPMDAWDVDWAETREKKWRTIESVNKTKDGRLIPVDIRINFIQFEGKEYNCTIARDITERKRAEVALRESEERLRLATSAANQGIFDLDLRTGMGKTSPEHAIMLGYDPAVFNETYQTWLERIHPEDRKNVDDAFSAYVRGEALEYKVESRQLTRSGEWKWILSTGKIIEWDSEHNPIRIVGINTDITERKRAEEALVLSEQKFRGLIESTIDAVVVHDINGKFTYASPGSFRILGYELVGLGISETTHPEDIPKVEAIMSESIDNPGVPIYEILRLKHKDGKYRICEGYTTNLLDVPGVRGIVGNFRDITERKRAEEDLALTNEELWIINRLISTTAGVADLKSILDMAADEALKIVGLEGSTVCLLRPDDVFQLAAHRATSDETIAELEHGIIRVGECLCGMCAKTGLPLILSTKQEVLDYATREALRGEDIKFHAAFPLMVESGCVGVLCVFTRTDKKPTERRLKLLETAAKQIAIAIERAQLFEEVKRNAEELERRVFERTTQLENANKEVEAFSYSVSHDLRAPLRAIDGFSLVMLEDYSDQINEEGKLYLNRIRAAAVRMGNLIDDILRLSRITRAEMVRARVDLSEIVRLIASDLMEGQPERKVDLIIEPGLVVEGDANLMKVALENMIGNAWKFTSKKDIARIEFGAIEERGRNVYFVRDNGAGFDQVYADKLFIAFQRLHSDAEFPGTGIGLATVKRIIHRHGGEVWAMGELDKGATFYFTLEGR